MMTMAQPISIAKTIEDPTQAGRTGISNKLIENVAVSLEAYLGSAAMTVAELMALKESSVVRLDAALNQAVELKLNGVPVAKGELVAVGDNFAVRLTEIVK
jgi:flagellar motor switch protein FliN/FliY